MYFSTNNMYDILYYWYAPKLVKDWYDYMMVSDEIIGIRFFKHLVDTHGYTTPEQLMEDYKSPVRKNEKRINSPEYKAKRKSICERLHKSLFLITSSMEDNLKRAWSYLESIGINHTI